MLLLLGPHICIVICFETIVLSQLMIIFPTFFLCFSFTFRLTILPKKQNKNICTNSWARERTKTLVTSYASKSIPWVFQFLHDFRFLAVTKSHFYSTWHLKDSKLEEYKVEQNIYLGNQKKKKKKIFSKPIITIEAESGSLKSLEYFGSKFLSNLR